MCFAGKIYAIDEFIQREDRLNKSKADIVFAFAGLGGESEKVKEATNQTDHTVTTAFSCCCWWWSWWFATAKTVSA